MPSRPAERDTVTERVIDGWNCSASPSGQLRAATNEIDGYKYCATYSRSGFMFSSADRGPAIPVPPAVLAWLIRPLLHEAWEDSKHHTTAELLAGAAPVANPHQDPTNG